MQSSKSLKNQNNPKNNYIEASQKIRDAIDILGSIAASDSTAREAIANLGVVVLDLSQR